MAEQIPFSIAENILTKLGSLAVQEIELARGARKELTKLLETLTTIKAVLLNAEERQQDPAVENWVRRFKDVIYDASDLLDDFATYDLGRGGMARRVSRFFSSSNQVAFHFKMGHRIKDIRGRLDDIANDISKFNFIRRETTSIRVENRRRETHSYVLTSEIVGRDEDKKKIIELLLQSNNEENLSLVAIVGIGGLGKTTLAQLVYNDEKVVKHFDLRLWVCVSDDFDVKILVTNIIKSATVGDVGNLELDQLKTKLHEKLSQKRYLLVLDDVWNEDSKKWDELRILLKVGTKGSKIVVTTRSSKVASIMRIDSPHVLDGLNHDQSWALFKNLAFGEKQQEARPNLLTIGEEITKMCNGVPLVITTLGRILHSKTEESQWLSIKNNENLMSLRDGNDILLVLKLSYDNLPSHLKQCFTYCALFPKDHEIERKMLIQLWMAQGYIQSSDEIEQLEDVGDQYFEELSFRSMFQEVKKDNNNNIISCKMHDLIHDLAQSLVKSEIFIFTNDVKNISERIHHVSFDEWSKGIKVLKAKPIRTLFKLSEPPYDYYGYYRGVKSIVNTLPYDYYGDRVGSIVNTLIPNCKSLRSLNGLSVLRVPKSIVKLVHLRYLDLSGGLFEVLPSGFTNLQNLQTLKLLKCPRLKELPRNIRKLINLRHLEIDESNELTSMPSRLGELTMLQTLPLFIVGNGEHKGTGGLSELKCLNNLRELRIKILGGVKDGALESKEANLKEKRYLQSLGLGWYIWDEDGELVMGGLQPHPNLKELYIQGYPGVRFPSWMSSMLPSLQRLDLTGLNALEYLFENCSSAEPFFPSLKTLTLCRLRHFKGWCRRETAGEQAPPFPSLSELEIRQCDQLTTFQLLSSPHLSKLHIEWCDQLTTFQLLSSLLLSKLVIGNCRSLESLQLPSYRSLSELKIDSCDQLTTFQLLSSPRLFKLVISICWWLESLQLPSCPSLSELHIHRCFRLTTFQLLSSPHLSELYIQFCHGLESLQLPSLPCLEKLYLAGVPKQIIWQILSVSSSLKSLHIEHIDHMVYLPNDPLQNLTCLKSLQIEYCYELLSLFQGIQHLGALEELKIHYCKRLNLSDKEDEDGGLQFQGLRSLRHLFIGHIPELVSLPKGLQHVTTLETLSIIDCSDFTTLPDWISSLTSLSMLKIWGCPIFKLEDPSKIAHIPEIDIP